MQETRPPPADKPFSVVPLINFGETPSGHPLFGVVVSVVPPSSTQSVAVQTTYNLVLSSTTEGVHFFASGHHPRCVDGKLTVSSGLPSNVPETTSPPEDSAALILLSQRRLSPENPPDPDSGLPATSKAASEHLYASACVPLSHLTSICMSAQECFNALPSRRLDYNCSEWRTAAPSGPVELVGYSADLKFGVDGYMRRDHRVEATANVVFRDFRVTNQSHSLRVNDLPVKLVTNSTVYPFKAASPKPEQGGDASDFYDRAASNNRTQGIFGVAGPPCRPPAAFSLLRASLDSQLVVWELPPAPNVKVENGEHVSALVVAQDRVKPTRSFYRWPFLDLPRRVRNFFAGDHLSPDSGNLKNVGAFEMSRVKRAVETMADDAEEAIISKRMLLGEQQLETAMGHRRPADDDDDLAGYLYLLRDRSQLTEISSQRVVSEKGKSVESPSSGVEFPSMDNYSDPFGSGEEREPDQSRFLQELESGDDGGREIGGGDRDGNSMSDSFVWSEPKQGNLPDVFGVYQFLQYSFSVLGEDLLSATSAYWSTLVSFESSCLGLPPFLLHRMVSLLPKDVVACPAENIMYNQTTASEGNEIDMDDNAIWEANGNLLVDRPEGLRKESRKLRAKLEDVGSGPSSDVKLDPRLLCHVNVSAVDKSVFENLPFIEMFMSPKSKPLMPSRGKLADSNLPFLSLTLSDLSLGETESRPLCIVPSRVLGRQDTTPMDGVLYPPIVLGLKALANYLVAADYANLTIGIAPKDPQRTAARARKLATESRSLPPLFLNMTDPATCQGQTFVSPSGDRCVEPACGLFFFITFDAATQSCVFAQPVIPLVISLLFVFVVMCLCVIPRSRSKVANKIKQI